MNVMRLVQAFEKRFAVGKFFDLIATAHEILGERLPKQRIVVNDRQIAAGVGGNGIDRFSS